MRVPLGLLFGQYAPTVYRQEFITLRGRLWYGRKDINNITITMRSASYDSRRSEQELRTLTFHDKLLLKLPSLGAVTRDLVG